MVLIKIKEDHYAIVDHSEIKEGDFVYDSKDKVIRFVKQYLKDNWIKKITHSTQPLEIIYTPGLTMTNPPIGFINIMELSLEEVKELIGEVDVEKKAREEILYNDQKREWWKQGYVKALEDNKEKKYTEEDMKYMFECGRNYQNNAEITFKVSMEYLQPKTEWEVEFIDGKLKLK